MRAVVPRLRRVLALLVSILELRAQERASQRAQDPVVGFLSQEVPADAAGHGAHEAALAFLRVVRVARVLLVAVGVGRVARGRRALSPWTALLRVLGAVLRCTAVLGGLLVVGGLLAAGGDVS